MINKVLAISASVLLLGILIPISLGIYDDYLVFTKGNIVEVKITIPRNYLGFMKFSYHGKIYDKNIGKGSGASGRKFGEIIKLKYLPGYEDDFLFEDENPLYAGVAVVVMILLCIIYFLNYAFFRKKNSSPSR